MAIGERIKKARIKKGLTQEELAGLLGYKSKSSVAHIENGRDIPRAMVVKLAQSAERRTRANTSGCSGARNVRGSVYQTSDSTGHGG